MFPIKCIQPPCINIEEKIVIKKIKPVLEDKSIKKIGQNIKFDYIIFWHRGIDINSMEDTMLMSYVLDAGKNRHNMDTLSEIHLGHKTISYKDLVGTGKKQLNFLSSGVASGFGILVVSDIKGNVIALNQNDGSEIWSTNVKGEVLSTAAIDPKTVVVKTGSGELIGLEKTSGETLWSYRSKLPTLTIRGSSSPVIFDNNVFVTFDNGRLGVFDINSGFLLWDGAISYTE